MSECDPFYVYLHRRKDTGLPFYVGKGSGRRSRSEQGRNVYWHHIVRKAGYAVEIVARVPDEELAHLAEMELIDKMRRTGVELTNMTDGGEGLSGFKFPTEVVQARAERQRGQRRPSVSAALMGRPKSAEHRARLSAAKLGHMPSQETRAKMSAARKSRPSAMLGKRHSEEAKAKISAAVSGDMAPFAGRKHSPESLARMSAAHMGRRDSDETRRRKSEARLGALNPLFGKPVTDQRKAKQAATLKARPLLQCPHCLKSANDGNARRWHFDNCDRLK